MTFGERVKELRRGFGLSQEAVGAQGFVSTPGWIKIENGQRQASEKLIENLLKWLVGDKYLKASAVSGLREELLTLKYLGSNSLFVRDITKAYAKKSSNPAVLAAGADSAPSAKVPTKAMPGKNSAKKKPLAPAKKR